MRDFGIGYRQAAALYTIEEIAMVAHHKRIAFLHEVYLLHNGFARCSNLAGVIYANPAIGADEFVTSGSPAGFGLIVINHLYAVGIRCNYLETHRCIEQTVPRKLGPATVTIGTALESQVKKLIKFLSFFSNTYVGSGYTLSNDPNTQCFKDRFKAYLITF